MSQRNRTGAKNGFNFISPQGGGNHAPRWEASPCESSFNLISPQGDGNMSDRITLSKIAVSNVLAGEERGTMATLTIEIPDDLMAQLAPLQEQLPALLRQCLEHSSPSAHVYRYILSFLVSQPTPQQISAFRPTPEMQARLRFLLDRSRQAELTEVEQKELNDYEQIEHLLVLLKTGNLPFLVGQTST